ncbi:MAG: nicotinate (nicotinamide) nucleotide adenylyltransferase [Balneola sp.]|nr:MAG: nicotinate (nicotinamide) nucleotide adenylyltransferase [Balneola sp.]
MKPRIGLFGGTFDPVHSGHVSIAHSFITSGKIDELWVLLTPYPPHKTEKDHAPYTMRLKMLQQAFTGVDRLKILTIENELPKPSYTVKTIKFLKEKNPDFDFPYFCMGEDSLASFHKWRLHEEIIEEVELLVAERPGANHSEVKEYILDKTLFVEHVPFDVSSTMVKEIMGDGEVPSHLVPDEVLGIIEEEALYKQKK